MKTGVACLALATMALAGACAEGEPRLEPDEIRESEWSTRILVVRGLHPSVYLDAEGDELHLRQDLSVEIGGVAAAVEGADGAGIRVRLSAPLAVGSHGLRVDAGSIHEREDALLVISDDAGGDGSMGDAAMDAGADGSIRDGAVDGSSDGAMDGSSDGAMDGSADSAPTDAGDAAMDAGTPSVVIRAGALFTVYIRADGALYVWGRNNRGQLALGDTTDRLSPTRVGTATDWRAIAAGFDGVLASNASAHHGSGRNVSGQLGLGDTVDRTSFGSIAPASPFGVLDLMEDHACAVAMDGALHCWGSGDDGALGNGSLADRDSPVRVGSAFDWVHATVGINASLAVRMDGTLWGWGRVTLTLVPTRMGIDSNWTTIESGRDYQCGLRGAGQLFCWGRNVDGQLGLGDGLPRVSPVRVGARSDWSMVATGRDSACGIAGGELHCWGSNRFGQLGLGDTTDRTTPTRVGGATDWYGVTVGERHGCGLRTGSTVPLCWGDNQFGQLGTGDTTDRSVPVPTLP